MGKEVTTNVFEWRGVGHFPIEETRSWRMGESPPHFSTTKRIWSMLGQPLDRVPIADLEAVRFLYVPGQKFHIFEVKRVTFNPVPEIRFYRGVSADNSQPELVFNIANPKELEPFMIEFVDKEDFESGRIEVDMGYWAA